MDEIAVRGDFRKIGLGKSLCLKYIEETTKQRLDVVLRTDERNSASMKLFASIGFQEILDLTSPRSKVYDPEFPNRIYLKKRGEI